MPSLRHTRPTRLGSFGRQWVVMSPPADYPAGDLARLSEQALMLVPEERLARLVAAAGQASAPERPPSASAHCDALLLLVAVARVLAQDPAATLLFLTSGLALDDERLLRHLIAFSLCAREFPDDLIVFGRHDDLGRQHGDGGWGGGGETALETGGDDEAPSPRRLVRAVAIAAGRRPAAGALLDTGCFSVWGPTLWDLARRCLPELTDRCDELRLVLRAVRDGRLAAAEEQRVLLRLGEVPGARSSLVGTLLARAPEIVRVFVPQPAGVVA